MVLAPKLGQFAREYPDVVPAVTTTNEGRFVTRVSCRSCVGSDRHSTRTALIVAGLANGPS